MHSDDDDDALLEVFDDSDEGAGGELPSTMLLVNLFGIEEADGKIVMAKRPGARLDTSDALNLAAWIVAESGVELSDFEELVRSAIEGTE